MARRAAPIDCSGKQLEASVARLYFYKLTTDDGGAPCVQDGLLSLAICKPMIRSTAAVGDLIFGFAANSLHRDNCLLYIARITDKAQHRTYSVNKRFRSRGDCIYERRKSRFVWRTGALYHGPEHLVHDLGTHPDYPRADVLLSTDFRYFGANGTERFVRFAYTRAMDDLEEAARRIRRFAAAS